jgi:phage-related protein
VVSGLASAIGAISDSGALEALGTALGAVLSAAAPLLPVVGQLVGALVSSLAPAVTAVATALSPVITAIAGALTPIIPPLTGAITTLVAALTPLVNLVGAVLAQAVRAVSPLLTALSGIFQQIAVALTPVIAQITSQLAPVFAQITPLISQLVVALVPLVQQLAAALLPALPPLIEAFFAIQLAVIQVLPPILQLAAALAPFVSLIITALAPVIQFAAEVINWLALSAVVPVITGIVTAITGIVTGVTTVLGALPGFVSSTIGFFTSLKNTVTSLVSGLVSNVVSFFSGLPVRAVVAAGSIVAGLAGVFTRTREAVVSRTTSMIVSAVTLIASLPGRAKAALGSLGGALVSAGADLIRGFIAGVRSQAGSLVSAARDAVKGAVDGAKSLLGISSPSKVFIEIGKFTAAGFVKGLTGSAADVKAAADQLVSQITNAFKGKNSRLDDVLIRQVRAGQKQLEALATQREGIAAKIAKANELATSVTSGALEAFSLQNLGGDGGAGGIAALTGGLDAAVAKIRQFNAQVTALAKRGLRKDLLSQVIGLGPDRGAALADTLAGASAAQLKDLNDAQKRLDAASKKLGEDSADSLFDAGKQASRGFLAGLRAQQKDVQDLMLTLARTMASSIRKALGIRSPSRVFAAIGRQTMAGLGVGIESQVRRVQRSVVGAANALTDPFGSGATVPAFGGGNGRQPGVRGGGTVRQGGAVTINLNGSGYSDADAQRIVNRVVSLAGL